MLADRIRSAGVRKISTFVLGFWDWGFLTALNFDCFLKATPAHGCFANESVIEISDHTLFRFLAPGASFWSVMLGDIDVHGSDLSRKDVIAMRLKRLRTVQERSVCLEKLSDYSQWSLIGLPQKGDSIRYAWLRFPNGKEWNGSSGQPVSFKLKLFVLLLTVRFSIQDEFPSLLGKQTDKRKVIATETVRRFPIIALLVGTLKRYLVERFAIIRNIFKDAGSDAAKSEWLYGLVGFRIIWHSEKGNKTKRRWLYHRSWAITKLHTLSVWPCLPLSRWVTFNRELVWSH